MGFAITDKIGHYLKTMKSIDLGEKYGESVASPTQPVMDKKHYPSFHIEGDEDLGLPKEGEMTICFCVTNESRSENADGKKHYSCTVEVRSIEDVDDEEPEAPAHGSDKAVSDVLDSLMEKHMAAKKGGEDY